MQTVHNQVPARLVEEIASQCRRKIPSDFMLLADRLRDQFGNIVSAVLLYGSCMRSQHATDGVVDLYVVVDSYKEAYRNPWLRYLNAWLPPNVFYMEAEQQGSKIRCKYAVISKEDLQKGVADWFHPYIWSRCAQPMRILYARDETTRDRVHNELAKAVLTFLRTSIPALNTVKVNDEQIWTSGLALSYASELRLEKNSRAQHIVHQNLGDYTRLTDAAAPALQEMLQPLSHGFYQCMGDHVRRRHTLRLWRLRRWQGRILTVLRLIKAAFTFHNCIDYAAWKVKRHTGISIHVTPSLQRHPILFGFNVLWQLIRRGALR